MLEDFGNMVSVNGQKIPAVNIQVEGVPGYIYGEDFGAEWYGVYFEIMFERGYLWVVSQKSLADADETITVEVFSDYAHIRSLEPDMTIPIYNWDDFLDMYNDPLRMSASPIPV